MRDLSLFRLVAPIAVVLVQSPLIAGPAATPPLAVSGRVLDDQGAVLAGAEVLLAPVPGPLAAARLELEGRCAPEPVARARSAADGSYRLVAPEVGLYQVRVEAKGRVPVVRTPLALVDELEIQAVRLAVAENGRVEIADAGGASLAGVRVRVVPQPKRRGSWRNAQSFEGAPQAGVTDAAGRFEYRREVGVGYRVVAVAPGSPPVAADERREARLRLVVPAGEPREVEVRRGADAVGGAAIWWDEPRVALALADERGRARVALPKGGELFLVAADAAGGTARAKLRPWREEGPERPQRLALDPPRRISGRVLDSESRAPIAGALVFDLQAGGTWATTDARGYAIELEHWSLSQLGAAARGYLAEDSFLGADPGAAEGPTFALEPASAIEGVVVDGDGRPVPAAEVTAELRRSAGWNFSSRRASGRRGALTDARGAFRLGQIAASGAWELSARRAGFGVGRVTVDDLVAGRRRSGVRIMLPPEGQLVGRVLAAADESPVVGARLTLEPNPAGDSRMRFVSPSPDPEDAPRAQAGEEGRFSFSGLAAGFFDLVVSAPGCAPARIPRIEIRAGEARDLGEVLLDPGAAVAGTVVDGEGTPVAGAEVAVDERGVFRIGGKPTPAEAISGEDGRFEIPDRRAGERLNLAARKIGFGVASASGVEVPPLAPVRLVLPALGRIAGRVLDEQGRPAEAMVGGQVRQAAGVRSFMSSIPPAATDDDGRFELTGVEAGEIALQAVGADGGLATREGLELPAGGVLEGVELRFEPGGSIAGRVVDADGRPLRDALIDLEGTAGRSRGGLIAMSDGDGQFRLSGVPPGRQTVTAERHPYRRGVREVEIDAGQSEVRVDFQLAKGLAVRGSVVDDQGAAAAEVWVALAAAGGAGFRTGGVSRADGSFEIEGVEPGRYTITAEKSGYRRAELPEPLAVESSDVDGVRLELGRGGAILGHVVGLAFDDLALVRIFGRSGSHQTGSVPDFEGAYRIDGLTPGEWILIAEVEGSGRRAQAKATLGDPPGEVEVDLEFGEGLVLSGAVFWRGEPVAGAALTAGGGTGPMPIFTQADAQGRFRMEGLAEGTYRIRASAASGRASATELVELTTDREIRLELASARIEGEVRDARDERPIRGAQVRVEPLSADLAGMAAGSFRSDGTNAEGFYRTDGVALGEQRVLASADGYAAAEQRVTTVDRDQVARVDFRLEPNEGVTVRVIGPSGLPPDRVWAAALDAGGNAVWADLATPGEGGRLSLSSVPRGEWTLLVGGWNLPVVRRQVSSPGDAGELVIPPPGALRVRVPALAEGALSTLRLVGADGQPYVYPSGVQPRSEYPVNGRERLLGRLPPGPWRIEVTAADGRSFVGEATVVASGEVAVEIQ